MKSYTDEQIIETVKSSMSFFDFQKKLTGKSSGSSYMHLKKRVLALGVDTSHFDSNWSNSCNSKKGSDKLTISSESILVEDLGLVTRRKTTQLRRAMLASGVVYSCSSCGLESWNNRSITLHIDHIDGNWKNNRIDNLRFLCPNCHSQTETFGYKGK